MRAIALSLLIVLPLAACEENRDPATPDGALHQLREAVLARDGAALLAASSAATRQQLEELHGHLKAQAKRIDETYPAEHRPAARGTYPDGVLEAVDPPALFAVLVREQLEALEPSPGLRRGLTALGVPAVDGDRASVSTQAGETLEFVLEDGVWKTTAFERHLQANLNRVRLNQQTLEENVAVFAELARREAAKAATDGGAAGAPASAPASTGE